ncbi:MAG: PAS domain S-box protein [Thermodesulfobacteriota bacterium]
MNSKSDFYKNILENLTDGAMAVDFEGKITLLNPAAAEIFGIDSESATGGSFAETFMFSVEGSDDFNQVVLDAIYEEKVDYSKEVKVTGKNGDDIYLKVRSSLLKNESEKKIGVIVVFTDVTSEKQMQEEQKRLNNELSTAYKELEERNSNLKAASKKFRLIRLFAFTAAVIVFSVIGFFTWKKGNLNQPENFSYSKRVESGKTDIVSPEKSPVSSSISISGKLEPLEKVNILSPYSGRIEKRYADFGQRVNKGDTLAVLTSDKLKESLREAETNLIKARAEYKKIKNWEQSSEYSRAKRNLNNASYSLEQSESKLEEAKLLYKNEIISENELKRAKDELRNSKMSLEEAKENMNKTASRGSSEKIQISLLQLKNSKERYNRLKNKLDKSSIKSPVSGVVLHPVLKDKENYSLEKGSSFEEGEIVISVGNMEGLSVESEVDEVDVGKIKPGQPVKIHGEGFTDITFKGNVDHVSTVANKSDHRGLTTFPVRIIIPELSDSRREKIRLGMTANMEVETYSNPEAVLVPINSVISRYDGHFLKVSDPETGDIKEIKVETGITTMTSVEIKKGLSGDEKVVIP